MFKHPINFRFIFGIFMVLVYMGMSYIFTFINPLEIAKPFAIAIGVLLFIYGIFRGIRLWKQGN